MRCLRSRLQSGRVQPEMHRACSVQFARDGNRVHAVPGVAKVARMIDRNTRERPINSTRRSACPALPARRNLENRALGAPAILLLALQRRILAMRVSLADRLGAFQFVLVGIQRLLGFPRLFVDLAGLDKAPLRLVVLARGGLVALAFVARSRYCARASCPACDLSGFQVLPDKRGGMAQRFRLAPGI